MPEILEDRPCADDIADACQLGIGHVAVGGRRHDHQIDQRLVGGRLGHVFLPRLARKVGTPKPRHRKEKPRRVVDAIGRGFIENGAYRRAQPARNQDSSHMAGSNRIDLTPEVLAAAAESKAWPFEEARKIVARYEGTDWPESVLFETGYGPSGLPHIGTFGEVARTTMVRHAFRVLTRGQGADAAALLFRRHGRDAQDPGQRAGPRLPGAASAQAADRRCRTRSAATTRASAHHNNAMLRRFLDTFGFDYEFASATDYYKSGRFDAVLLRAAERYDDIMKVMLPTLGAGAAGDLQPVPADLAEDRPRALRADEGGRRQGRHHHLRRRGRRRRRRCR